ncbi:hypothetical protein KI809_17485 [Geobacter pelophilus]|uniref:Uncharacterized protein n=1 Tax=Geoanaerobacter pelophilus TaxID=60036 RepID=A0AAW4L553_9BACT|nr:hypothetical protein [Geoanaerobacter pelophilus]MBT0666108.1 hypothetical protein [Geoanaerobacter pelophilus]
MRKSTSFLLVTAMSLLAFAMFSLHADYRMTKAESQRSYRSQLVKELRLTDLCLFTEARYTRHLSMADIHSAFQDHPVALEHFPSGALTRPAVTSTFK